MAFPAIRLSEFHRPLPELPLDPPEDDTPEHDNDRDFDHDFDDFIERRFSRR